MSKLNQGIFKRPRVQARRPQPYHRRGSRWATPSLTGIAGLAFAALTVNWLLDPAEPADKPDVAEAPRQTVPLAIDWTAKAPPAESSASPAASTSPGAVVRRTITQRRDSGELPLAALNAAVNTALPASSAMPDTPALEPDTPQAPPGKWLEIEVRPGDSLSTIFNRNRLSLRTLHEILDADPAALTLKRIKPGQLLRVRVHEGDIAELVHERDLVESLRCLRMADGFTVEEVRAPTEIELRNRAGVIDSSLFVAAQRAGLSDKLTMQVAEIFGWDIDFVLDIRQDDQFYVVHEEHMREGQRIRDGAILAAKFINQGREYRAFRYTTADGEVGYFSPDGRSMRKAFLRTPVNFTRISSRFNLRRRHPVLNTIRAHKGVDYAAPRGTPVKATGDGTVAFAGNKGGYGKMVKLRHGGTYGTVYAHLSRFARGLRNGQAVRQGQVIGYVGQTGLATGPHLHYEFQVNGAHRDPLKVKYPEAKPIPEAEMADFLKHVSPILARLDAIPPGDTRFAAAEKADDPYAEL